MPHFSSDSHGHFPEEDKKNEELRKKERKKERQKN